MVGEGGWVGGWWVGGGGGGGGSVWRCGGGVCDGNGQSGGFVVLELLFVVDKVLCSWFVI